MWHRDSRYTSNTINCRARNRFLAARKCFAALLLSKPRWPLISSYEDVKTFDEKYNNENKVVSLLTCPIMHQPTTKLHYKTLCKSIIIYNHNEHTYHWIAIRNVAANKYIHIFWKQTTAGDALSCYLIVTLFYITLTLQIMLINVTYLDISVSNIHIAAIHGLFCVCPQPIRTCVTIQRRLWLVVRIHRMMPARLPYALQYSTSTDYWCKASNLKALWNSLLNVKSVNVFVYLFAIYVLYLCTVQKRLYHRPIV